MTQVRRNWLSALPAVALGLLGVTDFVRGVHRPDPTQLLTGSGLALLSIAMLGGAFRIGAQSFHSLPRSVKLATVIGYGGLLLVAIGAALLVRA